MPNLVQCTRCVKILLNEEYDDHLCEPETKEWKKINFISHYSFDVDDREIITILAENGVEYEFREIPENKEYTKIPYIPGSTDLKLGEKSTEDAPECSLLILTD